MRLLTGSDVLVEDKLFATLDTTTRPLAPPHAPPILVTDTVGFIRDLPHALVASFRSTLEEARESWLVLHVVDASDPAHAQQQRVTEDVLRELGIDDKPTWVLLNKIDRVDADARAELVAAQPDAIPTCGLDATSGAQLRARISAFFDAHLVEARITVPWARHAAFAELRPQLRVLSEVYEDELTLTVRATPEVLGRLHHRLASR